MGRASTGLHGVAQPSGPSRSAAGGIERDPLAEARERFLAAEPVNRAAVREPILASWSRSREWNVAADRIDLSYLGTPDLDSALARAAEPVLRHLHEQLEGQPISIVLTDANGLVLLRFTGDRDLERHLDAIRLAPGFCYAEDRVGTNGIGTALESGGPAHVFGHEHYAERLEEMACAAAPVRDPMSGKTVGVLDLTCRRGHADALMISLARSTADQLSQALADTSGSRNLRLLQEYARTCRHTGGIVLALGNDIVMLNDHARQALSPADQSELISQATEALGRHSAGAVTVDLTGGVVARMFCHPLLPADGVFHVKLLAPATAASGLTPAGSTSLPGLVGKGAAWRRACRAAEASYERGEWLTLEGEAGAGKLALIRAVHQHRNPAAPCHVLDSGDASREPDWLARARSELLDGTGMLIIRHLHALPARQLRALADVLADAKGAAQQEPLRVAVTLDRTAAGDDLTSVLSLFPGTVTVPPLRHHSEDVRELVPLFLARLGQQGQVNCSPAAMRLLLRHSWPGNAAQLWRVLKQVVQGRRAGQIQPADLPPECWTVSRRVLSPLESIERDAIVQSLLDHGGNKIRAARALGMSRATVYRRIHEYGIVTPPAG
jgi:sigma-54 dependent transcriptional regulator, acetoin dehydrogenase operon transcriptional activator AcoR